MQHGFLWVIAGALAILMSSLATHESPEALQEEADALTSRDFAAQQVCQGQPFTWENDKTLVCHKEAP